VAEALCLRLTGEQRQLLTRRYTESTDAYQSYLKGRYCFNKWTQEGFKKAVELFEESIDRDPRFALAYAGLSHTYGLLAVNGYLATEDAMPRAEAAASTALEIDDQLAEAHLAAGAVKCFYRWDMTGARRLLRRSLELNPNFVLARHTSALYMTAVGRLEEAFDEIKQAQELDPLSLALNSTEAFILCAAGDYQRAIERCCDTLDMKPKFYPALERLADAYLLSRWPAWDTLTLRRARNRRRERSSRSYSID
jgi:tetratricopeptide (TPR) repeat protein